MTFVIIGGGIDLSVGALVALASVWATTLATQALRRRASWSSARCWWAWAPGWSTACSSPTAGSCRSSSTLAMLVSRPRSGRRRCPTTQTQIVTVRDHQRPRRRPACSASRCWSIIFAAWSRVGWLVLNRTTFGRRTFAIGGNPEAARLAGIDVRRHTALLYVLSGLCCGIAAS